MMFRSLAFLSAVTSAAAIGGSVIDLSTGDIPANSELGNRILSKARALNNNNNNKNYNYDYSWVTGYSIKFNQCTTTSNYYGGYFGGNNNNNNKNNNNNRADYQGVYEQRLIHFKLCPSSSCSSKCEGGADYVVDMNEFVNAYVESKLSAQEYNCERVRENCYCEDIDDDQACEASCYASAGLDYCEQNQNNNNNNNNNKNQFNLQEALECRRLEVGEDAMEYIYYKYADQLNQFYQYNYNQNGNNNNNNNNNNNKKNGNVCWTILLKQWKAGPSRCVHG